MTSLPTQITGAVPVQVLERRAVPRISIADLNMMDPDQLRDRLANSRRDDRPAVIKVLDLLDAPRNKLIANVFPTLEREARMRGETATGGTGRVTGSDLLRAAGVDNRIISAVAGLGLDLLSDPLTYVGPAGWALQAGRVAIRKGGERALRGGMKAAAAGGLGAVQDDAVKGLIEASGFTAPRLDRLRMAEQAGRLKPGRTVAGAIEKRIKGDPTQGVAGKTLARVGGDVTSSGGVLGRAMESLTRAGPVSAQRIEGARRFAEKFGRGTGRSVKIGVPAGSVGSEVGHIPFTDITLQVPAFTPGAKQAAIAQGIYRDKKLGLDILKEIPAIGVAHQGLQQIREAAGAALSGQPVDLGAIDNLAATVRSESEKQAIIAGLADDRFGPDAMLALGEMAAEAKETVTFTRRQMDLLNKIQSGGEVSKAIDPEVRAEFINATPEAKDALYRANEATGDYARLLDGVVSQFASSPQRDVAESVRYAIGASDITTGYSLTTPFANVAKSLYRAAGGSDVSGVYRAVDAIERGKRRAFGVRRGDAPREWARIKSRMTDEAVLANRDTFEAATRELRAIADEFNLAPEAHDEFRWYATAKAVQEANRRAGIQNAEMVAENGQLVDGPMRAWLKEFSQKAPFAGTKPGFVDAVNKWVASKVDLFEQMRNAEVEDGVLDSVLPGYIASGLTPQGKRAARMQAKTPGFSRGSAASAGEEAFQRPRTTLKAQFQGADGTWKEFHELDRGLKDVPVEQLDDNMKARLAAIEEYDAMPPESRPPMMASDPFEINALYRAGRFRPLTGSDPNIDRFFEQDFALLLGNRVAQHLRAVAKADAREMMAASGHDMGVFSKVIFSHARDNPGTELVTPNGNKVMILGEVATPDGGRSPIVRINGANHRLLSNASIKANDNPIVEAFGSGLNSIYFPEAVADRIDDLIGYTNKTSEWLDHMSRLTGMWKTVTLMHPSWTISNVIGDGTNALAGLVAAGGNPAQFFKHASTMAKLRLAKNSPEKLASMTFMVGERSYTGQELVDLFKSHRIWGDHSVAEVMYMLNREGHFALPSHRGVPGAGVSEDFKFLQNAYAQPLKKLGAGGTAIAKGAAGARVGMDRLSRHVVSPFMRANAAVSDAMRAAAMLAHMENGSDVGDAAQKVITSMFNYGDFSRFEDRTLRQLFPFYSWIRNNLAYQAQMLLERPAYAANFGRLKGAIEEMIAGDEAVPDAMRPKWMLNQLALQIGKDPSSRFAFSLANTIPAADVVNILAPTLGEEGAQHFAKFFVSSINPIIGAPLQVGAGREFFSGRSIGTGGDDDMTPSGFLARQIRPINELGLGMADGKIPDAFSRGFGQGVARTVLGGRVQAFDAERLRTSRLAEFKNEEEGLRRQIRRAERLGDKEASLAGRTNLIMLYEGMAQAGLEDEIPAWAREQIPMLRAE